MTNESIPTKPVDEIAFEQAAEDDQNEQFQTGQVMTIAGGHFIHDTFSAFLAPVLPLIRDNLGLTFAQTGGLDFFLRIPTLLTPFIGYLADRSSARYFIVFAPAVTATLMSTLGLSSNYFVLTLLLLMTGVSVAAFHAPAPAMIGRVSGQNVGRGMSFFMASGELGRTLGPILVAGAIGLTGFGGIWRLAIIGWITSLFLYFRLNEISARRDHALNESVRSFLSRSKGFFAVIAWILVSRVGMLIAITTWLPTYMQDRGLSFGLSAAALTILEAAGVVGALSSGTISDSFGRRPTLAVLFLISPVLMLAFIIAPNFLIVPLLILLGLTAISSTPVILATVQDQYPNNRALANGLFMMINFGSRGIATLLIGLIADQIGLANAFTLVGVIAFLSLPAVWFLPNKQ